MTDNKGRFGEATCEAGTNERYGNETDSCKGRFGPFGGQYVPETLMSELHALDVAWETARADAGFTAELNSLLNNYAGRPSRLYLAQNMTRDCGGAKVYLKREDLNHTGSHKINNVLGQALLAKRRGKKRIIAETGAGQHGVAAATAAALLGLECEVFMGREDTERQALNVCRMELKKNVTPLLPFPLCPHVTKIASATCNYSIQGHVSLYR